MHCKNAKGAPRQPLSIAQPPKPAEQTTKSRRSRRKDSLVRLPQQALQAEQHALHVHDGGPFFLEDVEADAAREVDVGVVDGRLEEDRRRRVRVVGRELEG